MMMMMPVAGIDDSAWVTCVLLLFLAAGSIGPVYHWHTTCSFGWWLVTGADLC
jgi:hypothetical protein